MQQAKTRPQHHELCVLLFAISVWVLYTWCCICFNLRYANYTLYITPTNITYSVYKAFLNTNGDCELSTLFLSFKDYWAKGKNSMSSPCTHPILLFVIVWLAIILFKVQDDLRHLKEQIISQAVSTEVIDLRTLESAIERAEQSVRVSVILWSVSMNFIVIASYLRNLIPALLSYHVDKGHASKSSRWLSCVFVGTCSKSKKARNEFVGLKSMLSWNVTIASCSVTFYFMCLVDCKKDLKTVHVDAIFWGKIMEKKICFKRKGYVWKWPRSISCFEFPWTFWHIFQDKTLRMLYAHGYRSISKLFLCYDIVT